jgi:hypothetical protein
MLVLLVCLAGWTGVSAAADFYVSPRGNDRWSGKLAAPNPAGTDGPFATLDRASDAVWDLTSSAHPQRAIVVEIAGGRYWLTEPMRFTPDDSGQRDAPVIYRAARGQRPVFSGGIPIRGWQKQPGGLWTTTVPGVAEGRNYFRQLFVDGQRRTPARIPNTGTLRTAGPLKPLGDRQAARKDQSTKIGFRYQGNDFQPWTNLEDVIVVAYHAWTTSRHHIAALDPAEKTVKFTAPSGWPMTFWEPEQRYYVENVREGLDAPGEWYLDRKTGELTYFPLPGEQPDKVEVIAPVLEDVLRLEGSTAQKKFVEHLEFQGLSFEHTAWNLGRDEACDGQAAAFLKTAAVFARGARHCTFADCRIAHTGGYGLWLEQGCRDCLVSGSELHDLGAGGIRLGQMSLPPEIERAQQNRVTQCLIHDGGIVYHGAIGVWIGRSSGNRIDHNEICDLNYTGVSVGWSWSYDPSSAHDNTIEFNHIHDLGRGQMSDLGGIYTLGVSPGTVLRNNLIHDVLAYSYGGWGIYPDEGSSQILIEDNLVYRTKTGGFHQHYGRENVVRNNIFAFSAEGQVIRSRQEPHPSFSFEQNIVYFRQGDLFGGQWGDGHYQFDKNIYWNASGETLLFPGDSTFEQWQATGQDVHSLVADPKFVDPSASDFRLEPDSPALRLGFRPIDLSNVGPSKPELKARSQQIRREPLVFASSVGPTPIDDDFEATGLGNLPMAAVVGGEDAERGASIRISDEQSVGGKHSVKFTDAAGLSQPWQPHLYYRPNLTRGEARFKFDMRVEPGATLFCEWRDAAQPYRVGPSLRVDAKGQLFAGSKSLLKLPTGWNHFEMRCGLGPQAGGHYELIVRPADGQPQTFGELACGNPQFRFLRWLGFSSTSVDRQAFFLDNVHLNIEK